MLRSIPGSTNVRSLLEDMLRGEGGEREKCRPRFDGLYMSTSLIGLEGFDFSVHPRKRRRRRHSSWINNHFNLAAGRSLGSDVSRRLCAYPQLVHGLTSPRAMRLLQGSPRSVAGTTHPPLGPPNARLPWIILARRDPAVLSSLLSSTRGGSKRKKRVPSAAR